MLLVHIYVFTTPPDGLILVYTSPPRRKVEMAPGSAHATLRGLAEWMARSLQCTQGRRVNSGLCEHQLTAHHSPQKPAPGRMSNVCSVPWQIMYVKYRDNMIWCEYHDSQIFYSALIAGIISYLSTVVRICRAFHCSNITTAGCTLICSPFY